MVERGGAMRESRRSKEGKWNRRMLTSHGD